MRPEIFLIVAILGIALLGFALRRLALSSNSQTRIADSRFAAEGFGVVVFDGDSVSAGYAASPGHEPDQQLPRKIARPLKVLNVAAGGSAVYWRLANFDADVAPLYNPSAPFNIILFHAGDNDINQHKSAAETYAALTQYIVKAHQQGWKFVISTELARPDFSPEFQAELAEYNALVIRNRGGADAVVDFGGDPRMALPEARMDRAIFDGDLVHPSDGGYTILTDMLIEAVEPMIGN